MERNKAWILMMTLGFAGAVTASPTFTILFDPGVGFSAQDQTAIQNAVNFYTSNMTSNFSVTIAFGSQVSGGGSSEWFTQASAYNSYYNALVGATSADAVDVSAIASLGGGPQTNNPVTGSLNIVTTTTLATALGLGSQASTSFAACGGITANACITLSSAALNTSGTPLAGLGAIVQHEVDEVLGTSSNLPNGGGSVPGDPMPSDLFRYSAPGVRRFALNTSTSVPCSGSPTAYSSVNGGGTNLATYNNCNNGGDYGDWIGVDGLLIQDAFGPDTQAAALDLSSPEVQVLDAVGYNFSSPVPEPSTVTLLLSGLAIAGLLRRRVR